MGSYPPQRYVSRAGKLYDLQFQVSGAGAGAGGIGGWKELGRTTLSSSNSVLDVSSLPDKRYYMTLIYSKGMSQGATSRLRYNGDTGNTKSYTIQGDGGIEYSQPTINGINLKDGANVELPWFNVMYHANKASIHKLCLGHTVSQNTAGAGNAPKRHEMTGKQNLTSAIDQISSFGASAGNYLSGSEIVVLGYSSDDTHTDNFWEELASVDLSGGTATSLSSGTFTAKKYLWIQIYSKRTSTGTQQPALKVGNGTVASGSPYSYRYSTNGVSDLTATNQVKLPLAWLGSNKHFTNTFIINNASTEKLAIIHDVANVTTGASSAPQRVESVAKWSDTSNQINIIELHDWDAYTFDTQTIMKVWGSD
jgi:hypothetical protein